ncbi:MAG: polysaccharide biosynthesis/export family protein [Gemmatimonadaceae bacterium]|nr:polysaccharide biosynthesis/export family protein [Gemmatimonadaceae bacterium]
MLTLPASVLRRCRRATLGAAAALLAACAPPSGAPFVWANDYVARDPSAADAQYVVGVGDLLAVQVFDNDKISGRGRVRSDGKLSLPLVSDVLVAGKTPAQVAADVQKALKDGNFVLNPRVNVVVEDVLPVKVTVLGAVSRAGNYAVEPGSGVAEALAGAGGLTEFAHKDRIFVLRKVPTAVRIRFTFASLTEMGPASRFRLQQGDIVVVE